MTALRQYIYTAEECGFEKWPDGLLRLEGIPVTTDPREADLFVVPGALTTLFFPDASAFARLPYFKGNETKHVFFDCSDNEPLYDKPCLFLRCNVRTWYLNRDPGCISWPWPVEQFRECIPVPDGGFKYDVSFQGWDSGPVRHDSIASCLDTPSLHCDIRTYTDFTGYIYDKPEGIRRRKEFRRSMHESRIMLCPESIAGVFPYRFFEAMSAGRVPLLVSTDYVLPRADEIPYDDFCLFLPRSRALDSGRLIRNTLDTWTDSDLVTKGQAARYYWEQYLDRDHWPRYMAEAVQRKLGVLA